MESITFTVQIPNHGEVKIQVPRQVLINFDSGNSFIEALRAALANHNAPPDESKD